MPGPADLLALLRAHRAWLLALWAAVGLVLGLASPLGPSAWLAACLPVLAVLLRDIVRGLPRGEGGLDIIAAIAIAGALALGEWLAGAVVALMLAGGQLLEALAQRRARASITALLARQPRSALRHEAQGLVERPIEALAPGDRLLIRPGEILPVDGTSSEPVLLEQSALTGEPLPQRLGPGEALRAGASNAGEAFMLRAHRPAAESAYAAILRLVAGAQASKAPLSRLAERWALGLLAATLLLAGLAWGLSGDPARALAVLVVATPCPLILAVPVALIAGLSRAAKAGVLVKHAGALESLAATRVLLLDKTGTLTEGRARLIATDLAPGATVSAEALLRLAAGLDQASGHVLARALAEAARARGLELPVPWDVREVPGEGLSGQVEGHAVVLGGPGFVARTAGCAGPAADAHGPLAARVAVAIDGRLAGVLVLDDPLRPEAPALLAAARAAGIGRIALVSGDSARAAEALGARLGLDDAQGGLSPEGKVEALRAARAAHGPVTMLGDGVNDAPALAAADTGIAMGGHGAGAGAEVADAVVLSDRLDHLAEAVRLARRAVGIARQSAAAGLALSGLAMLAAALGWLSPVQGALIQEAIDIAVILNALRVLRG